MVVAGAMVMALGSAAGAAAAKPRPPVLAFSPAPYNYGQVAAGGAASQTFTLANTRRSGHRQAGGDAGRHVPDHLERRP